MQGMINLWYRGGGVLILQVFESRLVHILQACISQAKVTDLGPALGKESRRHVVNTPSFHLRDHPN